MLRFPSHLWWDRGRGLSSTHALMSRSDLLTCHRLTIPSVSVSDQDFATTSTQLLQTAFPYPIVTGRDKKRIDRWWYASRLSLSSFLSSLDENKLFEVYLLHRFFIIEAVRLLSSFPPSGRRVYRWGSFVLDLLTWTWIKRGFFEHVFYILNSAYSEYAIL